MIEPTARLISPATRQRAVCRHVNVDDEQRNAQEHQQQSAPADGQDREAEQGGDERDSPERAGQDDARMEDLEADPGEAREEEQREDVRIDQRVEQAREEAEVHIVNLCAGEVEGVALGLGLHAV